MTPATDHVLGGPLARASHHGTPDPVAAPVFTRWRTEAVKLTPMGRLLLALLIVVAVCPNETHWTGARRNEASATTADDMPTPT